VRVIVVLVCVHRTESAQQLRAGQAGEIERMAATRWRTRQRIVRRGWRPLGTWTRTAQSIWSGQLPALDNESTSCSCLRLRMAGEHAATVERSMGARLLSGAALVWPFDPTQRLRPVAMIFRQTQTQILSLARKGGLVAMIFPIIWMIFWQTFRLKLWRWGAACSMPRVSDIDNACGISAHHMFLSNCVVQVMRVWSLPAVLSPLAKHDTPRRGNASWFRADPCGLNPDHAFR
jgi:hypothetical protein